MGSRGPKPDPDQVKDQKAPVRSRHQSEPLVRGAVDDAPPEQVSAATVAVVTPPKWLKSDGLRIWKRLAPTLRAAKLLTVADAETFGRYCRNFARWLDLQKRLDEGGEFYEITTASGTVRRADPAFTMADRIERMLLAVEDRFGLNPAERQRIMAARSNTGVPGDLFSQPGKDRRPGDPAAQATPAAEPEESPIGLLN